jgi:hypothetical protein
MDAESKERGRDYLAADIFLTAARFAVTPQSIVYPKRRCGALGGFLRAQWRTSLRRERELV